MVDRTSFTSSPKFFMCELEKEQYVVHYVHIILRLINFKSQLPTSYQYQKINLNFKILHSDWMANQKRIDF